MKGEGGTVIWSRFFPPQKVSLESASLRRGCELVKYCQYRNFIKIRKFLCGCFLKVKDYVLFVLYITHLALLLVAL